MIVKFPRAKDAGSLVSVPSSGQSDIWFIKGYKGKHFTRASNNAAVPTVDPAFTDGNVSRQLYDASSFYLNDSFQNF